MTRGIKRPMPVPDVTTSCSSVTTDVERRVASNQTVEVKNFLQHIKNVPERTWREEREAQWEVAIRGWIALMETWNADSIPLAAAVQNKAHFQDKAQILVDIFTTKPHRQF